MVAMCTFIAMDKLPPELIVRIAMSMTLKEVVNFTIATYKTLPMLQKQYTALLYERQNPVYVFRDIVDNTHDFMREMTKSGVVLSGSRVSNFFVPGSCTNNSDYDFYCPGSILNYYSASNNDDSVLKPECYRVKGFIDYMRRVGLDLSDCDVSINSEYDLMKFSVVNGKLKNKKGEISKIQLIFTGDESVIDSIVSFSSTASQCFISGFAAVHMYIGISSKREMVVWHNNAGYKTCVLEDNASICLYHRILLDIRDKPGGSEIIDNINNLRILVEGSADKRSALTGILKEGFKDRPHLVDGIINIVLRSCIYERPMSSVTKYESRGYNRLSWNKYVSSTGPWLLPYNQDSTLNEENGSLLKKWRVRSIGDKDSLIVPFSEYLEGRDRTTATELTTKLSRATWYEYDNGTCSEKDKRVIHSHYGVPMCWLHLAYL